MNDDLQYLTGVRIGHNAFTSVPPISHKPVKPKRSHHPKSGRMSKLEQSISALETPEEKQARREARERARLKDLSTIRSEAQTAVIAKRRTVNRASGTLHGLSHKADELVTAFKARENALIARKNVSAFNVAIATPDDSRKTQSIKGKL